jgi:hypothetical protein
VCNICEVFDVIHIIERMLRIDSTLSFIAINPKLAVALGYISLKYSERTVKVLYGEF